MTTLSDLTGRHVLTTSAILGTIDSWCNENVNCLSIGIDGKTYTFIEDPSDGYRSYMDKIVVEDGITDKLKLAPRINREVLIIESSSSDLIYIYDIDTGHHWATIGTDKTDDYYPYCVLQWYALNPEKIDDRPLKPIPIKAAQAIAETYGYDQVVVFGRRVGDDGGEHMTTYGTNIAHCKVAEQMGDVLKKFMGWDA